jgi:tetratricopeptide (TPR) repeat protein
MLYALLELRTLLTLLILSIFLIFNFKPLKEHILSMQQITDFKAKSRVLGYQTPDFKELAQVIYSGKVLKPAEYDNYRKGMHYLSFYNKGSELFPNLFEMHYLKGVCYASMGEHLEARRSLEEALRLNPAFLWTYYNLAILYLNAGNIDRSLELLSAAQNIPPAISAQLLYELQGFNIILRYLPSPEDYVKTSLEKCIKRMHELFLAALIIKKNSLSTFTLDSSQWRHLFF